MALTIRNISEQQIETAKTLSGKATAAAALVETVVLADSWAKTCSRQRVQIIELETELARYKQLLESARSSAAALLDATGQNDLLAARGV